MRNRNIITRIVCSGGGAKGIVYPAAFKAIKKTGTFDNVVHLSGASAGAITSSFMAFGMNDTVFREKLLNTNMADLMGSRVKKQTEGCCFLTKDGSTMLEFIRESIIESVKSNIRNIPEAAIEDLSQKEANRYESLLERLEVERNPLITFSELALLNRLDPVNFKKLSINAVQYPNGELQIFDCDSTPDVEVALAARASASIPVVLEPVEIVVNGVAKRFIDGGMYDNLPTDYFDKDEHGNYIPNVEKEQTLVFAFGEGLDNTKNPIYQGLYGPRWDEVIENSFLDEILQKTLNESMNYLREHSEPLNAEQEANLIYFYARKQVEVALIADQLKPAEAAVVLETLKQTVNEVLQSPEKHQEFWRDYKYSENQSSKLAQLVTFIKSKLAPALYDAGFSERLKRNTLTKYLAGLNLAYKNTEQKKAGYHKLRKDYPLRTVELRVGNIKTTHFDKAKKVARTMDALGYIDTTNYVANHDLYNDNFNPDMFYSNTVNTFKSVYMAVLQGSEQDINKDFLLNKLRNLEKDPSSNPLEVCHFIKEYVENHLGSNAAFSLARAVEFNNGDLTPEELFKETYVQAFKESSWLSLSKITGKTFFLTSSLEKELENKNMFHLLEEKTKNVKGTSRAEKVFDSLNHISSVGACFQPKKINGQQIKANMSRQTISKILNKLTSDQNNSWETFINICLDFKNIEPETNFVTRKPLSVQMRYAEKIADFNDVDNILSLELAVTSVLKALSTPKTSEKAFGETTALKQFLDRFNSGEITGDVRKVIYQIVEQQDGIELKVEHFTSEEEKITKIAEVAMEQGLDSIHSDLKK